MLRTMFIKVLSTYIILQGRKYEESKYCMSMVVLLKLLPYPVVSRHYCTAGV